MLILGYLFYYCEYLPIYQNTKTITKTRHKNERGTACKLQTRSANSSHGRAYSAKKTDSLGLTTLGAPSSVNSPHRRANSAKKTNCLSLSALCALVGLILWACLHQSQPSKRKQNISCRGSCSLSISVGSLERECKKRDIYPKKKYFKYYDILPSRRGGEFESERAHRNNNILREMDDRLSSNREIKSKGKITQNLRKVTHNLKSTVSPMSCFPHSSRTPEKINHRKTNL